MSQLHTGSQPGTGGGSSGTVNPGAAPPAPPPAPALPPGVTTHSAAETPVQPQAPVQPGSQQQVAGQQAPQQGFDLSAFAAAALQNPALAQVPAQELAQRLVQELTRTSQQAQAFARYQPYLPQIEALLAQQGQQQPQQKPGWWQAPPYDPSWEHMVVMGQDGSLQARPGADPSIPMKLAQWRQFQRSKLDEFAQDPMKLLGPGLQEQLSKIVDQQVQARLAATEGNRFSQEYVQRNAGWLFEQQNGQTTRDPFTGQPKLSAAGQKFAGYVRQLEAAGLSDVRLVQQQAQAMVERDLYAMIHQGQQPQNGHQQQYQQPQYPQNGLSHLGTVAGGSPQHGAPPPHASLQDMLRQAFRQNGITDEMIANSNR